MTSSEGGEEIRGRARAEGTEQAIVIAAASSKFMMETAAATVSVSAPRRGAARRAKRMRTARFHCCCDVSSHLPCPPPVTSLLGRRLTQPRPVPRVGDVMGICAGKRLRVCTSQQVVPRSTRIALPFYLFSVTLVFSTRGVNRRPRPGTRWPRRSRLQTNMSISN